MQYSILTSEGWRKFKYLEVGLNIYTLEGRTIVLKPVEEIREIEENQYTYRVSEQDRIAFSSTKLFDKKKEHKFSYLISGNFKIPLTVDFKTNIDGIVKADEDIKDAVKKKITYSWVRLLSRECTLKYIKEWQSRYNGLVFSSDKEAADLQILLARIGRFSLISGNKVEIVEKNGTTESYKLIANVKTKLPIINGESAHYFVRDENRNVFII